jgi:selenocysteine lyase/cysteine desulfurase
MGGYEAANDRPAKSASFTNGSQFSWLPYKKHSLGANAIDSYSRALSSIAFREGDVILTTGEDYASNQISFLSVSKRFGVNVVRTRSNKAGGTDLDHFEKKIKAHTPQA